MCCFLLATVLAPLQFTHVQSMVTAGLSLVPSSVPSLVPYPKWGVNPAGPSHELAMDSDHVSCILSCACVQCSVPHCRWRVWRFLLRALCTAIQQQHAVCGRPGHHQKPLLVLLQPWPYPLPGVHHRAGLLPGLPPVAVSLLCICSSHMWSMPHVALHLLFQSIGAQRPSLSARWASFWSTACLTVSHCQHCQA